MDADHPSVEHLDPSSLVVRARPRILSRSTPGGHTVNSDLLARVFDSIPDEILVLDTDMVIQGANASFLRGNDLTLEEVRGLHCYEVSKGVRGECRVAVDNCPFQKVMSGGGTDFHTRKNFDADGNVRYVAIVGAPLIDADGAVAGMVEMTRDITHRILLERELAASEVRLQHFLELAPLATYVKNRQSQYVAVNPSACALLGRTKSEILGRTDLEILPREVAEQWGRGDREVLQEGREVTIETEITSGGRHVFLSSVKYPVLDGLGRVTAVCGLLKDATELREAVWVAAPSARGGAVSACSSALEKKPSIERRPWVPPSKRALAGPTVLHGL